MAEQRTANHLFCFGFGYSAAAVARRLASAGWHISGTCRTLERSNELTACGVTPYIFTGATATPDIATALRAATHILVSIPPDATGDPAARHFGATLAACNSQHNRLQWIGYLSTTGVYGDRHGGWVDETTPPAPQSDRAHRRRRAEIDWLDGYEKAALPVHIFRLPGIYGPGRNTLAKLKAGTARRVVKAGQVFSRIHVDDLAAVLTASMTRPRPGAIYTVADDEPAPPQDVIAYGAHLLGIAAPPETAIEDAGLSPMALSFYAENKRVSNRRIKEELGVRLRYPSYREGLASLLSSEKKSHAG